MIEDPTNLQTKQEHLRCLFHPEGIDGQFLRTVTALTWRTQRAGRFSPGTTMRKGPSRGGSGWLLGVRQEDDAVGQFRVKLSQQNAARYPSIAMTSTVIATVSRIVAMPESSGRPPALSTSTNGVPE
jgi:hypothetical protein